jgi:vacuolar protein sorting-associated protein 35
MSVDTQITNDLKILQDSIVEEHIKGNSIDGLYELVQYVGNVVPRIYLMITIGVALARVNLLSIDEILSDLLEMIRGIQHPLRGLFARYYLLQVVRNLMLNS